MLKNKIIGKKIRNIIILLMSIIIMIGTYKFINKSKAEKIIEIKAIAIDNSEILDNEEFILNAKQLEDENYEIELPESINGKIIEQIIEINLNDFTNLDNENLNEDGEETTTETETIEETEALETLEIIENRIYLTKEQIENKQISIKTEYDMKNVEQTDEIAVDETTLYNKILKYEDEENSKLVEVRGYLPINAELQVEEVEQEKLTQIFGDKQVKVAYDIKIICQVITQVPTDEADPEKEPEQITETIEINPEDFNEKCQVTIKDIDISENSQVYHVKDDNTYEKVTIKDNSTEGNVSFEAQSFSVYAITDGDLEIESTTTTTSSTTSSTTSTSTTTADTTSPTVKVNGSQISGGETAISAGTLDIDASNYGKYVNYTSSSYTNSELGIGGWKLLYADDTNVYLIADNYIESAKAPNGKGGTNPGEYGTYGLRLDSVYADYSGINDIDSDVRSKLLSSYENAGYTSNSFYSAKATAYLLDINAWYKFKDSTYAEWAVGGPSLELLLNSYNNQYTTKNLTYGTRTAIQDSTNYAGYYISPLNSSEASWSGFTKGVQFLKYEDDTQRINYCYVASPSGYSGNSAQLFLAGAISSDASSSTAYLVRSYFLSEQCYQTARNTSCNLHKRRVWTRMGQH